VSSKRSSVRHLTRQVSIAFSLRPTLNSRRCGKIISLKRTAPAFVLLKFLGYVCVPCVKRYRRSMRYTISDNYCTSRTTVDSRTRSLSSLQKSCWSALSPVSLHGTDTLRSQKFSARHGRAVRLSECFSRQRLESASGAAESYC